MPLRDPLSVFSAHFYAWSPLFFGCYQLQLDNGGLQHVVVSWEVRRGGSLAVSYFVLYYLILLFFHSRLFFSDSCLTSLQYFCDFYTLFLPLFIYLALFFFGLNCSCSAGFSRWRWRHNAALSFTDKTKFQFVRWWCQCIIKIAHTFSMVFEQCRIELVFYLSMCNICAV